MTQLLAKETEILEVLHTFRAMNTGVEITIFTTETDRAIAAARRVEELFRDNEATLSRFRAQSELTRLNQAGYLENVSDLLYDNIAAACRMHEFTGGIFDPTLLDALEAAGYDRSFELIAKGFPRLFTLHQLDNFGRWKPQNPHRIELDPVKKSIKLAPGVRIDLGGIAKGTTVDQAAGLLREAGFTDFMVSAGGDMYLEGRPPFHNEGWRVLVDDPNRKGGEPVAELFASNAAVATSSSTGRSWYLGRQRYHHLIDPRTHEPANTLIASVTVVAGSVQVADVMAKTALILGPEQTRRSGLIEKAGLQSLVFVTLEGEVIQGDGKVVER
jgi:thiamine biosynthesis lipoprotein